MRAVGSAITFVPRQVGAGLAKAGRAVDGAIEEGTNMFAKDYLLPLLFND